MEKTAFDTRYQEYLKAIEEYLNGLFAEKPHWADLYEAMRYSLLSGGKRLRSVQIACCLKLIFCSICKLCVPHRRKCFHNSRLQAKTVTQKNLL